MKRAGILGLAIVSALALNAALTQAGKGDKKLYVTRVSVDDFPSATYFGDVKSPKARCEARRKVTLFNHEPADEELPFGTTVSDRDGSWRLEQEGKLVFGDYQFHVDRKRLKRKHGTKRICREADTKVFTYP